MVRGVVAVGAVLMSALVLPAPAAAGSVPGGAAPAPVALAAPVPVALAAPVPVALAAPDDLTVTVTREGDRVVAGRLTTYRITVANPGSESVDVIVRASTPRQLKEVTATAGTRSRDGVDWTLTVPAEGAATMMLAGVYGATAAEGADRPYRVALTACALDADRLPLSCDTDIADLEPAGLLEQWWWVAVPLIGLSVWYLRRRRRPYAADPPAADGSAADGSATDGSASGEEAVVDLGLLDQPAHVRAAGTRSWLPRRAARSRPR